jgi:predicted exporter
MGTTLLTFTLLALSAVPVWATAIGPATVALGLLLCVTNVRPDSQPVASEND